MHVALEDGFVVSSTMIMGYGLRVTFFGLIIAISVSFASAQTASTQAPQAIFAATSAHVAQPGSPVSIRIFRWSTEEERAPLIAALNTPPPPPPPAPAPPPPAATPAPTPPPPDGDAAPAPDPGNAGRAGRAGRAGGRDGRGGRGNAPPPPPITPIGALTNAIAKSPTIGYIWTDEATGYSIKYAYRLPMPAGGERVVLATSRVLGGGSIQWKPTEPITEYDFTIIELRLNAKGLGEGKTSLTSKVIVDNDARTLAIENYAAAPVILQNVKKGG
jgi:hypothetical protein